MLTDIIDVIKVGGLSITEQIQLKRIEAMHITIIAHKVNGAAVLYFLHYLAQQIQVQLFHRVLQVDSGFLIKLLGHGLRVFTMKSREEMPYLPQTAFSEELSKLMLELLKGFKPAPSKKPADLCS